MSEERIPETPKYSLDLCPHSNGCPIYQEFSRRFARRKEGRKGRVIEKIEGRLVASGCRAINLISDPSSPPDGCGGWSEEFQDQLRKLGVDIEHPPLYLPCPTNYLANLREQLQESF